MKNLIFIALLFIGCISNTNEKPKTREAIPVGQTPEDSLKIVRDDNIDTATKLFKGAWFDIRYPEAFAARPSLRSATNPDGYESAIFTSANGAVSFYVFSPQWSGHATDIALQAGEKLVSRDSSYTPEKRATLINWTIEANDKSYRRSYQEIRMDENINWIFGMRYKNQAVYDAYKDAYLAFKNSIIQYGD